MIILYFTRFTLKFPIIKNYILIYYILSRHHYVMHQFRSLYSCRLV